MLHPWPGYSVPPPPLHNNWPCRWKFFVGICKVVKSKTNLFQVVAAGVATCRLTCLLDRWQEQADKHADDGDDDE